MNPYLLCALAAAAIVLDWLGVGPRVGRAITLARLRRGARR